MVSFGCSPFFLKKCPTGHQASAYRHLVKANKRLLKSPALAIKQDVQFWSWSRRLFQNYTRTIRSEKRSSQSVLYCNAYQFRIKANEKTSQSAGSVAWWDASLHSKERLLLFSCFSSFHFLLMCIFVAKLLLFLPS